MHHAWFLVILAGLIVFALWGCLCFQQLDTIEAQAAEWNPEDQKEE